MAIPPKKLQPRGPEVDTNKVKEMEAKLDKLIATRGVLPSQFHLKVPMPPEPRLNPLEEERLCEFYKKVGWERPHVQPIDGNLFFVITMPVY